MPEKLERVRYNPLTRHLFYWFRGLFCKKSLTRNAIRNLNAFGVQFHNEGERQKTIENMIKTYQKYGFGFDEYLCYHFDNRTDNQKRQFVPNWERAHACHLMNSKANDELFDNKYMTYEKFRQFYGREVLELDCSMKCKENFKDFIGRHNRFIVKRIDGSFGRGVQIYDVSDFSSLEEMYGRIQSSYNRKIIVEELIEQSPEMALFHPRSVNTVRVSTVRFDDVTRIIHPFMRLGRGDSVVDNAGAGGIIAQLDGETGKVYAAADEHGKFYLVHPDTQVPIVGFTVPRWDDARELACRLAQVVPDNRYTGWDLALTPKGWVMVEGNRKGQFVWQIPRQIGFRGELNDILGHL